MAIETQVKTVHYFNEWSDEVRVWATVEPHSDDGSPLIRISLDHDAYRDESPNLVVEELNYSFSPQQARTVIRVLKAAIRHAEELEDDDN